MRLGISISLFLNVSVNSLREKTNYMFVECLHEIKIFLGSAHHAVLYETVHILVRRILISPFVL